MEKKEKKKLKIRWTAFLITFGILFLLVLAGWYLSQQPIKNIYVKGNSYLSDEEVIELAELEEYPSFLLTFSFDIKNKVEKSPWVESAKIKKSFWGIVRIEIVEREPLFEKAENHVVVLTGGVEIPKEEFRDSVTLLLNYVPDTKYDSLVKQMKKMDPSIRYLISEMTYLPNDQDKDRFLLYMNDGNYVYLTLTKFKHINYYEQVLETLEGRKGILYLDSGNHFQIME